jgi:hypothetical protein
MASCANPPASVSRRPTSFAGETSARSCPRPRTLSKDATARQPSANSTARSPGRGARSGTSPWPTASNATPPQRARRPGSSPGKPGEIEDLLGKYAASSVWGAAFEDLLAANLPDGRNLADEYLRRRGWTETAATREYIAGLRHSAISLYEVSGLVPGESMLLRDLIRGGAPIREMERSGSRGLRAHPGSPDSR